jgi:hypothetical protein
MTGHWFNGTGHPDWRYTLDDFKSDDESMATCLGLARIAARTDLPILILGETGTGKTMLARAIHNSSTRTGHAFVSFNSSALSDTLLFGHEKGAFTGHQAGQGKFEQADRGALFLGEFADMSAAGQAKILRAVEYGEFERLGGRPCRRTCASSAPPTSPWPASPPIFRKDLFYRISGITRGCRPLSGRRTFAPSWRLPSRRQEEVDRRRHDAADHLLSTRPASASSSASSIPPSPSPRARSSSEAILPETSVEVRTRMPASPLAAAENGALADGDLSLRAAERGIHQVLEHFRSNKRAPRGTRPLRSTLDRKLAEH